MVFWGFYEYYKSVRNGTNMNIYTKEEKVQIIKWCYAGTFSKEICEAFSINYERRHHIIQRS